MVWTWSLRTRSAEWHPSRGEWLRLHPLGVRVRRIDRESHITCFSLITCTFTALFQQPETIVSNWMNCYGLWERNCFGKGQIWICIVFWNVNNFQVYRLRYTNHLVGPSAFSFKLCVNWQLIGSVGFSVDGCLQKFVPRPTMGLGQDGFPDSCGLFGAYLQWKADTGVFKTGPFRVLTTTICTYIALPSIRLLLGFIYYSIIWYSKGYQI